MRDALARTLQRGVTALAGCAIGMLLAMPAVAQVRPVPAAVVPIVLPPPPAVVGGRAPFSNTTSSVLFDAMLAISRAQQVDPQAAQTASFQYIQAVQQFRSGNFAGANIAALQALSTAGQAQVRTYQPPPPSPMLAPQPAQISGLAGGLYGADAPAIDADAFLALARGILEDCAARHDPRLAGAKRHLAQAQQDFAVRNWQATRTDAKAAIDACAKRQ